MPDSLTIGEFSRITHLSVKTLRHYHEVGLLEPVEIDPGTGYRRYTTGQIPTAQVIRRFRSLNMPVEDVKAVLGAPDHEARNALIAAHLSRLEDELAQLQLSVASLRSLLEPATAPIAVEHRTVPATTAAGDPRGGRPARTCCPGTREPSGSCTPVSPHRACDHRVPAVACSRPISSSTNVAKRPSSSPSTLNSVPSAGSRPWSCRRQSWPSRSMPARTLTSTSPTALLAPT